MDIRSILAELDQLYAGGDRAAIEEHLVRHVTEAVQTKDYSALLTLYNEMEGFYRNTGKADQAFDISENALELIADLGLENTVQHATTLINGATAGRMSGLYEQALGMYAEAQVILERLNYEDSYLMATLYNNMSQVFQGRNQPEKALGFQTKALGIIDRLPHAAAESAITRINIALSMMSLGRREEAAGMLDEAGHYFLTDAGRNDPHLGSFYAAMAELQYSRGDTAAAAASYTDAAEAVRRFYGESPAWQILTRNADKLKQERN